MPISWNRSLEQREVAAFEKIESRDERIGATLERGQLDRGNRLRGRESQGQGIAVLVAQAIPAIERAAFMRGADPLVARLDLLKSGDLALLE